MPCLITAWEFNLDGPFIPGRKHNEPLARKDWILAFHRSGRVTNGRLEGANDKLGVLKRIAYRFVNADNFAARALLWCPPVAS